MLTSSSWDSAALNIHQHLPMQSPMQRTRESSSLPQQVMAHSSAPTYPAGMSGVIGVAATTNTNTIADFSNTGSASVAAPGVGILATKPGGDYGVSSGTSAASAEVAGLATLLAANGKSAAEIATQIKGTTDPVDGSSIGQVNVFNALTATGVVTPEPTPNAGTNAGSE